jgi:hypothetical protein
MYSYHSYHYYYYHHHHHHYYYYPATDTHSEQGAQETQCSPRSSPQFERLLLLLLVLNMKESKRI